MRSLYPHLTTKVTPKFFMGLIREGSESHSSPAKTIRPLDEYFPPRLSSNSIAASRSCNKMITCPKTVTDVTGPKALRCFSQCCHSNPPFGGKSATLPTKGNPLGPGGSGNPFDENTYLVIKNPARRMAPPYRNIRLAMMKQIEEPKRDYECRACCSY